MTVRLPRNLTPRPAAAPVDALQYEVLQEQAFTLGRLSEALQAALRDLRRFEAEPRSIDDGEQASRREPLLDAAAAALWEFVVQREACGLRNTEAVLKEYGVPSAVRLRMGVTRRG